LDSNGYPINLLCIIALIQQCNPSMVPFISKWNTSIVTDNVVIILELSINKKIKKILDENKKISMRRIH